jgi:hypothetical protein
MFRASMFASAFLASALGIMATSSTVTPASAFSSQVYGARNQQVFAHYHPTTTVSMSRYRFPGKKAGSKK